jgi:hypothetical protein
MLQNEEVKCNLSEVPFKTTLSFEMLLDEIRKISEDKKHPLRGSAKQILEEVEKVPELLKPIKNEKLIEKHQPFIDKLMAFVFNHSDLDSNLSAATPPFIPKPFYTTRLFDEAISGKNKKLQMAMEAKEDRMLIAILYQAFLVILKKFYNLDINIDLPFTFKLTDETTGKVTFYKMNVNSRYSQIKVTGKLNDLTDEDFRELFDRVSDIDFWNEKIPLKKFEFIGFLQFSYINITQEYVISQLKSDLLDKNSILTQDGFKKIKEKVNSLLEIPGLEFGLASATDMTSPTSQNLLWRTIIPQSELKCDEYRGSLYERAFREKRPILTDDFRKVEKDKVVNAFLKKGFRSHIVVPLMTDEKNSEKVGMIEFASTEPGLLNLIQVKRFAELFPVFALALKRSMEEWNDRIRSVIQEEFTAIHPTVAWRFREVAGRILDENTNVDINNLEPIVFNDVVPVYGATDIRNSSVERNNAIQADLAEHLSLVKSILVEAMHKKEMPLLSILAYKIEKHMHTVTAGLKAGDEVSILDFFKKEVEPVFIQLRNRNTDMASRVDEYFEQMDEQLGVVYRKRKDFEDSLTKINEEVADVLDKEQEKAQDVFPHYFEKYRTDGVEYNAYIGQSLVEDADYDEIYLNNIRLWQLLTMVKIARRVKRIQPELKTKLDVTQLILVQSNPLSIAFRQDEKKFDVAGAYNIRYEITKKRIDKAVIKGTRERVTQVDKIAIIYSLADEIDEYMNYLHYLIAEGYLQDNIEYLELEDLQGASGLRALRVAVNFGGLNSLDQVDLSEIDEFLKNN